MKIVIVVIGVFLSIILILMYKNFKIKKQIKTIFTQLTKYPNDNVTLELSIKELELLAKCINNLIEDNRQATIDSRNNQNYLKDSIANISHDMRTPLTSIIGYLQLATKTNNIEEMKNHLGIALNKAEQLKTLISDFFNLSVLESDNNELELVGLNVGEILKETIFENICGFQSRNIEPIFHDSNKKLMILAEEHSLKRVFQNLINNAINYSLGNIYFYVIEEDSKVCITIKNAIYNEETIDTEKIFQRFYKVDNSRHKNGTGLGLFIVKLLTTKLQGTIVAEASEGYLSFKLYFNKYNKHNELL